MNYNKHKDTILSGLLLIPIFIVLMALIIGLAYGVPALIIRYAWNYVLLDQLHLVATAMTFKTALVLTVALSVIGGFFKSSQKSN